MYAGHLPHLEVAVSYLGTGDETTGVVTFVNSGVICLEKDESGYHMRWCLIPSKFHLNKGSNLYA